MHVCKKSSKINVKLSSLKDAVMLLLFDENAGKYFEVIDLWTLCCINQYTAQRSNPKQLMCCQARFKEIPLNKSRDIAFRVLDQTWIAEQQFYQFHLRQLQTVKGSQ